MKLLKSALLFVVMLSVLLLFMLFILCDMYTDSQLIVLKHSSYNTSLITPQDILKEVYSTNTLKNFTKNISIDVLSNHRSKQETPIVAVPAVVPNISLVAKPSVTTEQSELSTGPPHTLYRYAICSSYWEQQSNGILNLFSLQRWANSIGLTVVEPFAYQSELTFPEEILYNNNTLANTLRLRDYLDLDHWNAETNKAGILPLETWENFVLHSTKKVILVVMPYSGPGGTYTNDEIERHSPCQEAMSDFFHEHSKLFQSLQFEVVRNVCFSFDHYIIPSKIFNAALQVEDNKDATVWITEWQGVDNGRVAFTGLKNNEFGRIRGGESKYLAMIKPSGRLVNDSYRYVHEVLGVNFNQYDALVIRHKMIAKRGKEWNVRRFNECASQLEKHTNPITNKLFLATDLGKFGDKINPHRLDLDSQRRYTGHGIYLFKRYLNMVYGNKSIDSYENDFVRVSNGITDSGYIAALQRTIALHAKRVFLVGGHSSFQMIIKDYFANQRNSNAVTKLCFK